MRKNSAFQLPPPRYFLLAATMVPLTANATTLTDCPHAIADYATYTPTEFYSGRPTDQLGSPFNFLFETDTCFTSPVAEWCDENIAMVPSGAPPTEVEDFPPLFLFFHGGGNRPSDHTHMANTAAYAGYPTILLSWDASADSVPLTRSTLCTDFDVDHDNNPATNGIDLYGGECTDGCLYDLGVEMLTGVDTTRTTDIGWKYTPRPIRSVVQRTAMFLNDLYLFDTNSDATNDYHWDRYCEYEAGETQIDWDNVVVGGFSMGANMASFISFTEGTHGLLAIEGGGDICRDIDPITYDDTLGLAEYYDTFAASSIQCGDGTCEDRVMAFHGESEELWDRVKGEGIVPQLSVLGFHLDANDLEIDLDDGYLDTLTAIGFSGSLQGNIMITNQDPAPSGTSYHGSMAVDEKMPKAVSGRNPVNPLNGENASDTYLFPAYLEAMCWLQLP